MKSLGIREEPALASSVSTAAALRRLRILLAEDNPVNQKVAQRLLEKQGHSVAIASTSAAAAESFSRELFDLILMDVQMPVMDGYEAARTIRLRENAGCRRIPIVALTAHTLKGDRETCLKAGMDDYLSKPIQAPELYEMLARWSGRTDIISSAPEHLEERANVRSQ